MKIIISSPALMLNVYIYLISIFLNNVKNNSERKIQNQESNLHPRTDESFFFHKL